MWFPTQVIEDAQEQLFDIGGSEQSSRDDGGPCYFGVLCYRIRMVTGTHPTRLGDCKRCRPQSQEKGQTHGIERRSVE